MKMTVTYVFHFKTKNRQNMTAFYGLPSILGLTEIEQVITIDI